MIDVPKDVSDQIQGISDRAVNESQDDIQNKLIEGTSGDQFTRDNQGTPTQYQGVDNDTLMSAIESRGMRGSNVARSQLKSQIQNAAIQMKMKRLTNAAQLVSAEHQQNERARMNRYIMKQNRKRARAGVLGNILGIAGAAGGAMVGGPAGAAAGYGIGQGVGQMAGEGGM